MHVSKKKCTFAGQIGVLCTNMKDLKIESHVAVCSWDELTDDQKQLLECAKEMTQSSYCPYSQFHVGAAVRLSGGIIVKGSNQENAAYPSGLCAERTTLFAANANYPDRPVEALAIACFTGGHFTAEPGSPCGSCRQVMIETEHRFNTPMQVLLYGEKYIYVFKDANQLLPLGFFAEDLKD